MPIIKLDKDGRINQRLCIDIDGTFNTNLFVLLFSSEELKA